MMTVELPWPDPKLSPNARVHWAERNRIVQAHRETAMYLMSGENPTVSLLPVKNGNPIPITVTFHPPDKRKRDRDNLIASMKAYQDGIAQALGVDDSRFEPTYRVGETRKGGAVVVQI